MIYMSKVFRLQELNKQVGLSISLSLRLLRDSRLHENNIHAQHTKQESTTTNFFFFLNGFYVQFWNSLVHGPHTMRRQLECPHQLDHPNKHEILKTPRKLNPTLKQLHTTPQQCIWFLVFSFFKKNIHMYMMSTNTIRQELYCVTL